MILHIQKKYHWARKEFRKLFFIICLKKTRKILRLNAINFFWRNNFLLHNERKKTSSKNISALSIFFFAIDEHCIMFFFLSHIRFVCIDLLHNDNEKESEPETNAINDNKKYSWDFLHVCLNNNLTQKKI